MTFAHEGNKTYIERDLVNFEKMVSTVHLNRTEWYSNIYSVNVRGFTVKVSKQTFNGKPLE